MLIRLVEKCGRCPREEATEVTIDEAMARTKAQGPKEKALVIKIDGIEAASYDYLCEDCRGIVAGYCEGTKPQKKKSARRFKRVTAEHRPGVTSRPPPRRSVAP